jgi:hypothetical protein
VFIAATARPFRSGHNRVLVQKAKDGGEPKTFREQSKRLGPMVRANFFDGIKTFKNRVSAKELRAAWEAGDLGAVMKVIPWAKLPGDLDKTYAHVGLGLFEAGEKTLEILPPPVQAGMRWDTKNPFIKNYLNGRKERQIVQITGEVRGFIQGQVNRALDEGLSPGDVAANIKGSIGLYEQQQTALENYRARLIADEVPASGIPGMVAAYEDELLDYRARMIGVTEVRMALNNGQNAVWQQAADKNLIDRKVARKVWVCDTDPCEDCEAMDGESVPIDEPWVMKDGTEVYTVSDSHPHCKCGQTLDIDGDTANADDED